MASTYDLDASHLGEYVTINCILYIGYRPPYHTILFTFNNIVNSAVPNIFTYILYYYIYIDLLGYKEPISLSV